MFSLVGTRKNGHSTNKNYDDERVARFEFDVTRNVATELNLYKEDILIDEYHLKKKEIIKYMLKGQSAFNEINKDFDTIENARKAFDSESKRCDWLVLYEEKNNNMTQLDIYLREDIA